ncbi:hypothetical protein POM88_012354 [Heracleum sosnowskyi]|uniref:Uncharacterized protein n=1 Tax=Heracleum sosnowskyi TaxID=360622 RepID=A0AAD8IYJ5_9APIA|nr:hypothetical protein POM88_012354 [Heracleum sosnowskyi]
MVLGDVNLRIHHGGEFILKDCNRYYEGDSFNDMVICALESGNCIIYIDHAYEVEDDKEGSESDGNDSDWIESEEDDSDADYSGNESDKDEEFNEIVEKKKLISKSKKNPKVDENQAREDDFNAQLSTKNKAPKIKKEVDLSKNTDWESDHDSDSFNTLFAMNERPEDKIHVCYTRTIYLKAYEHMLKPMKGSLYWPQTGHPDILPPKDRRMPGRPKKIEEGSKVNQEPELNWERKVLE